MIVLNLLEYLQILDVRSFSERDKLEFIANSININLDELRDNLDKLDSNKETVIYCAKGMRGYLASRILKHNGFSDVKNLSGGYKIWDMSINTIKEPEMV